MHLLDLFESTNEGYTVTRGIDRERYQERAGLEGPFQTKSGKVVYYDKKEGKYYDPDTDMYIDHDDYAELDEGVGTYLKGAVLAGLLGMGVNQMASMTDAKNSPLGQAMAQAAEQGDQYAAKHLEKLDSYFDLNDTGSIKILSQKYLGKTLESVYEEIATTKKSERILKLMRAKHPQAANDMEALLLAYEKGQSQDRQDINTLYSQNREEDREIEAIEKELERIKARRGMNEDYYETDEQRELARLGRILMDMGKKRDDDVGTAMGRVGSELTRYGTPQGVSNIEKLEKVTGQPESVIMKMMALAQKVEGDVAVGDETAGNDEEEVKEASYEEYLKNKIGRASDEFDVGTNNWEVQIDGKPWKVFKTKASAMKASSTIQAKYGKDTAIYATRKPVSEGAAKDFDEKFRKHLDLYTKSQAVRDYRAKKAQMNLDQMKATDPGNINPLIIDKPKAHKKAREKGVPQSVITTNQNRKLPEAKEDDIKIGDTVQTLKMGQMQGTVTGFSKKSGINKVLFKHENGKTYAAVPENLKVISSKKTESQVAENIDLRHDLKPGTYKHKLQNIQVSIDDNGSVTFITPAEWEIEGDQEYLEYVESQLAMPEYWEAELSEGGFFDPDQPNPGDMVKHRNGAVGKVKKIGTQDDETWVYFKDKNGEMNFGQWKKSVFPVKEVNEADINESSLWDFGKRFKEKMAPRIKDFFGNHGYKVTSGPNGYLVHTKNGVALELINYPTMGPVIMFNKAHDKANAPEKKTVIDTVKRLGRIVSTPGNTTAFGIPYKNGDQVLDVIKNVEELGSPVAEAKKKPVPTDPSKWSYYKSQAKKKFDVYPSAYANAWAAKQYKAAGGGWRMGKPKK